MAANNISSFDLANNDVLKLENIIRHELVYYKNNNSPFFERYGALLNTIAGLGCIALLLDKGGYFLSAYQQHLCAYICHRVESREKLTDQNIDVIATSMAKMIELAMNSFQYIKQPRYFDDFISAINESINKLAVHDADRDLIEAANQLTVKIVMPR